MQETWVGQTFGKLKVISYEEKGRKKICHCKCSCGNPKTLEIPPYKLKKLKSCGCN